MVFEIKLMMMIMLFVERQGDNVQVHGETLMVLTKIRVLKTKDNIIQVDHCSGSMGHLFFIRKGN